MYVCAVCVAVRAVVRVVHQARPDVGSLRGGGGAHDGREHEGGKGEREERPGRNEARNDSV